MSAETEKPDVDLLRKLLDEHRDNWRQQLDLNRRFVGLLEKLLDRLEKLEERGHD